MKSIREEKIDTLHLYVVPEYGYVEEDPVRIGRIANRALCLICAVLLFVLPSSMDVAPREITVSLQFLPLQTLATTVETEPTGVNAIPATNARGWLTAYNGSILVQSLPKGFIVTSQGGVEAVTDEAVVIPASQPPTFGMARVPAHAMGAGNTGNINAFSINEIYGTSLYLKNLTAFSGGTEARTEQYATEADKSAALSSARYRLNAQAKQYPAMLSEPCAESSKMHGFELAVEWSCQFARYTVPTGLHVHSVKRSRDSVKLEVSR